MRQEFLFQQIVAQRIIDSNTEKEEAESVLLSVLSMEIYQKVVSKDQHLLDPHQNAALVSLSFDGEKLRKPTWTVTERFNFISKFFQLIEKTCMTFELEFVKTDQMSCLLMRDLGSHPKSQLDSLMTFIFEVSRSLESMYTELFDDSVSLKVGVAIGPCCSGIFSMDQFVYDVTGKSVILCETLRHVCPEGEVLVSAEVRELLQYNSNFEFCEYLPEGNREYGSRLYTVQETKSIWSLFLREADWMSEWVESEESSLA
eukprot:TRINITY_DN8458_c0_g1_i1.p1 TRINITY_DN8458_c0_g1~~TRINITY_DN8458_c0_g1_i1.p1  ORF type:complete len:258 (+),score=34.72 TRINITY_DN8458_c0_g1_i1:211-984(+)